MVKPMLVLSWLLSVGSLLAQCPNSVAIVANPNPVCAGQPVTLTATIAPAAAVAGSTYQWYVGGIPISAVLPTPTFSVTPTATTTYQVTVRKAGCVDRTKNIAVTVRQPAKITKPTADTTITICKGNAANLTSTSTGTAPLTYTWVALAGAPGSSITNVLNTGAITTVGTYNYKLTVSNMCGSSTRNFKVIVVAAPVITPAGPDTIKVCKNIPCTLSVVASGAPLTYSWSGGGTTASKIVSTATIGTTTHTVTVTNPNNPTACNKTTKKYVVKVETCPCDCDPSGWSPVSVTDVLTKQTREFKCGDTICVKNDREYDLSSLFKCTPNGCTASYKVETVYNGVTLPTAVYTTNPYVHRFKFSQCGFAKITITPTCGNKLCTPCVVYVRVDCCDWRVLVTGNPTEGDGEGDGHGGDGHGGEPQKWDLGCGEARDGVLCGMYCFEIKSCCDEYTVEIISPEGTKKVVTVSGKDNFKFCEYLGIEGKWQFTFKSPCACEPCTITLVVGPCKPCDMGKWDNTVLQDLNSGVVIASPVIFGNMYVVNTPELLFYGDYFCNNGCMPTFNVTVSPASAAVITGIGTGGNTLKFTLKILNPNVPFTILVEVECCGQKCSYTIPVTMEELKNQRNTDFNKVPSNPNQSIEAAIQLRNAPNPAATETHIFYELPAELAQNNELVITNLLGVELLRQPLTEAKGMVQIEISNYPTGFYWYSVVHEGRVLKTRKFMKH